MTTTVKKDGRVILTGADYTAFRQSMYRSQRGECSQCGRSHLDLTADPLTDWSFHVHHVNGRGMGGGKRDDTSKSCVGLCGSCHRKEHNQ